MALYRVRRITALVITRCHCSSQSVTPCITALVITTSSQSLPVSLPNQKKYIFFHFGYPLRCAGFHTGFFERGGNSWLTYLASTFGRLEMSRVPFEQVLDIFKQKNRRIEVNFKKIANSKGGEISQRGGISPPSPPPPPPCMKP